MQSPKIKHFLLPLRQFTATLLKEHLSPGRAAAAVFLGIFIANVPIYGFQTVAVIALAAWFRLNKPLAVAATFVNNPILQPFLVIGAVELGHFALAGKFMRLSLAHPATDFKAQFGAWLVGSLGMGLVLGAAGAVVTFALMGLRRSDDPLRERFRFVEALFSECSSFDRGFVRWKMRLDRIFEILCAQDPGSGPVLDLGCGYGIALGFAGFHQPERRLLGCDLDEHRIDAARLAFRGRNAELRVCDARNFDVPQASLILILDVLQYLSGAEQLILLQRCSAALAPGGKLIFRIPHRGKTATSRLSVAFDRLIFFLAKNVSGPTVLSAEEYEGAFRGAGLQVVQQRMRNRLPLSHLLFVVAKPGDHRP